MWLNQHRLQQPLTHEVLSDQSKGYFGRCLWKFFASFGVQHLTKLFYGEWDDCMFVANLVDNSIFDINDAFEHKALLLQCTINFFRVELNQGLARIVLFYHLIVYRL